MTKKWITLIALLIAGGLATALTSSSLGCGGTTTTVIGGAATAPPVDLQAPIIGRIAITPPDATGKVTIIGTEGAVQGSTIVMGINRRIEAGISKLWKITDVLIPTAYAQISGPIDLTQVQTCLVLGHKCGISNQDGSFSIIMDFSLDGQVNLIGDQIDVVLLSEQGTTVSDITSLTVPSTEFSEELQACVDEGVDGTMMDLINIEGNPMTLYEGTDGGPNRIEVGPFPIELPGCHAQSLTLVPSTGDAKLIMLSKADQLMWITTLNQGAFTTANTYDLAEIPLDSVYVGETDTAVLAVETELGFAIQKINLADGSVVATTPIPEPVLPAGYELTELISMKTFGPFEDGRYLIAVLTKGQGTGDDEFYVSFFDGTNLENISAGDETLRVTDLLSTTVSTNDISDIEFYSEPLIGVGILFANHGEGYLHLRGLESAGVIVVEGDLLTDRREITTTSSFIGNADIDSTNPIVLDTFVQPRAMAFGFTDSGSRVIYILTDGLELWKIGGLMNSSTPEGYSYLSLFEGITQADFIAIDNFTPDDSILIGDDSLKEIHSFNSFWQHTMP